MKALATLGGCRGSPEPLLVALVCDIKVPFCHELAHFMFPITRKTFQKKKSTCLLLNFSLNLTILTILCQMPNDLSKVVLGIARILL